MNKYSVIVSGRVSKIFEIEADCKEDAMIEALEFFNEFATNDYVQCETVSEIFTDAELIPEEEIEEESTTEE